MYATPAQVRVHGLEHLQEGQSYVVVANHLSQFDILALYGWLDLDLKWVMKKELRKVPVLGAACAAMGHVFIDRKDTEQAVNTLKEARARLHDGTSVLFFPEGTRSPDGRMSPFKKGAFMMAKDIELPILPLTLIGTEKVLPNGGFDLLPGTIDLVIHAPISAQDVKSASAMALRLESQNRIASALAHDQVPQELV
jgi:1-acyl-sn-glycerol-3-phosphate acyltransferase